MENNSDARPWEENGPRSMKSIPLSEIDDTDRRFQFRFQSPRTKLEKSLAQVGQLNPIKIMPSDGAYVILDGFSRYDYGKQEGWKQIMAMIYPILSARDAKKISWECNIARANLSPAEKANGILMAQKDGLARDEIASLFRVSERHINRCLNLPERLRAFIDGEVMTMAHAYVLKDHVDDLADDDLVGLVEWVRASNASSKKLKAKIKREHLLGGGGGRPRTFGFVEPGVVRGYAFELKPDSPKTDRVTARAYLRNAMREIDSWTRPNALQREN